jgi:MFS family permease
MGLIALSVLVYDQTGSALATTVLFLGTGFLPAVLAPILVTRVEQPPPRFALPVLYCGEAAAFGALALLASNFSLAAVVALATFDMTLALAARALTRAVSVAMLGEEGELRSGNAILNFAFTWGAAVGPAVAGLVVAGLGVQPALLLDAVSFYAIAWILFTAGDLPQGDPEPGQLRERLRSGLVYIREQSTLKLLLVAQGAALIFFSAVLPIEVVYVKETLGAGDSGYGLLLASWGVGMVLGGMIFAALRRAPLGPVLFFSTLAVGAGYLGMAVAPSLGVACITAVLGGTGNGVQWVTMVNAIQDLTVSSMQARVMSVLESIARATPGIGYLAGGLIASFADPRATFFFAGAGVVALVVVVAPIVGPHMPKRSDAERQLSLDAEDEVMVELIPAMGPGTIPSDRKVIR